MQRYADLPLRIKPVFPIVYRGNYNNLDRNMRRRLLSWRLKATMECTYVWLAKILRIFNVRLFPADYSPGISKYSSVLAFAT